MRRGPCIGQWNAYVWGLFSFYDGDGVAVMVAFGRNGCWAAPALHVYRLYFLRRRFRLARLSLQISGRISDHVWFIT